MLDVEKIKNDFPILKREINGRPLVYLDSASTSQKPSQVIEAIKNFYENHNSNVHRSVYTTAAEATEMYEGTREKIRKFLDAGDYEIIFTKNCTEAINIVADGWAMKNLGPGDRILSSVMEHHSNIVPWQRVTDYGMSLDFLDVDENGELEVQPLEKGTKLISLTHASNVLGTINNAKEISKMCHDNGALLMLDAAQSVPHMRVSLKDLDCDFAAFSSHKMLGPTGVGVLAVKKNLAEEMGPLILGSDMIKEVTLEKTTFSSPPTKFESGTPNISGVVGLSAAIDYLSGLGMKNVESHEKEISKYALYRLSEVENVKIYGPKQNRSGIVSFNLGDVHSHDLATIMDEGGVAIRSGHHCAQPLMKKFGVSSMARASFYVYNGKEDIDVLIDGIKKSVEVFKLRA